MQVPAPDKSRFDTIQALRFVAALLVVITHATFYAHERLIAAFPIWPAGARGVDIFFVISGFVMWHSSRSLIGEPQGWRIFVRRRIERIVPLYWLATSLKIVAMLLVPAAALHAELSGHAIVTSYLFIPAFNSDGALEPLLGVGWTLNFEMFFYAVFAFALFATRRPFVLIAAVLAVCSVGSLMIASRTHALQFYLNDIVLEFLFGMLLARYAKGWTVPPALSVGLIIAGFVALLFSLDTTAVPRSVLYGLPSLAIIAGAVWLDLRAPPRIPRWVLYFGNASYALYLIHPMVAPIAPVALAKLGFVLPWLSVAFSVMISLAMAAILHSLVEKPVSRWLAARTRRRQAAIVAG
ncbi:acyltransferase [Sphingomonas sp.]|uniref:acyltransferase family protein n=1 Tax=Sphingomonas sp. TaxID=28214 RepID=UPI002EDA4BA8